MHGRNADIEMSEIFDKQVNAQKEKTSGAHVSSCKPTKKVCDENESRKKRRVPKIFLDRRKEFIRCVRKTGAMDIKQLHAAH